MTTERDGGHPLSRLRGVGPGPDPVFRALLREQLLAAAERPAERPAAVRPRRRRRPVLAVAAGLLLVGGLGGTAAVNAQRSLPGDQFHVVKRAGESARLNLPGTDAARGRRELGTARTRVRELARLVDRADPDPVAVRGTLRDMDEHTRVAATALFRAYGQTGDRSLVTDLAGFAVDQRARLTPLLPALPATAGRASLALIDDVLERARALS